MSPFDPYKLMNVDQIMRGAKFPGGMIVPPATFRTSAPVKGPGLFERMGEGVMPTPAGLGGLLSDEDLSAARGQGILNLGASLLADSGPKTASEYVGPMQSIGRGLQAMQGGYRDALGNSAAMKQAAQQLQAGQQKITANQTEMDRQKALLQGRHDIISKYPVPTDPKKMSEWLNTVIPRFIDLGDDDTLDTLLKHPALKTDINRFQQTQTGDSATTFDPATGKFWDPSANGGKGAWTTSVQRRMNPDELLAKQQDRQLRALAIQNGAEANQQRSLQTQSNAFQQRYKAIADRAPLINQGILSMRSAMTNPALYPTAIGTFIQAADQKAQLRVQMVHFFTDKIDPSIHGSWERLKARMIDGRLPQYQADQMVNHLEQLLQQNKAEWDARRNAEIKRHPDLEGWLPTGDELFSYYGPENGGGAGMPDATQRQPGETIDDYLKRTGSQ